jgi:fucose permease
LPSPTSPSSFLSSNSNAKTVRKSDNHPSLFPINIHNATYHNCFFFFKRFVIECLSEAGEVIPEKDLLETSGNENMGSYKAILTTPAVHLLAFFILFYVGAEVTIGGTVMAVVITTSFLYMYILAQ